MSDGTRQRLELWGGSFADLRPRAQALWEELEGAYQWFLQPGSAEDEIVRRWLLVVHLVHNFKSSQFIRQPVGEWPGVNSTVDHSLWPTTGRLEPGLVQRRLIGEVGEAWTAVRMGFGVPTTSALLSLIDSRSYVIIDRFSLNTLVGGTTGPQPALCIGWEWDSAKYRQGKAVPVNWPHYHDSYLPLLKALAGDHLELRTVERALFLLGAELARSGRGRARDWDAYRSDLSQLLSEDLIPKG